MQQINLFLNLPKVEKPLNERQSLLKEIVDAINVERMGTKFPKITGRAVAMKVSHIPTQDLYYLISVCKDYKNRSGSFSRCFFGSLKA